MFNNINHYFIYMSYTIKIGYCNLCNSNTKFLGKKPNHILHLILTIITQGLWAFVWLMMSSDYRCDKCGGKPKGGIFSAWFLK